MAVPYVPVGHLEISDFRLQGPLLPVRHVCDMWVHSIGLLAEEAKTGNSNNMGHSSFPKLYKVKLVS